MGEGDGGKRTVLKRHQDGEYTNPYMQTMGVEVAPLPFNTNKGPVVLNIWDCAGREEFFGLKDGYYIGAQGAIIMFDVTSKSSYKNVRKWYKELFELENKIPIVLCGNKVDCEKKEREVKPKQITFHREKEIQYYDISAKSNYKYDKPFVYLIRKFMGDETVHFVEG